MSAATTETTPAGSASHHAAFFRQSGWLMIANVAGGLVMYAVHFLAKSKNVSAAEYGAFGVMLAVAMCVPNLPLQMVFAQQTAKALATNRDPRTGGHDPSGLARNFRAVSLGGPRCVDLAGGDSGRLETDQPD